MGLIDVEPSGGKIGTGIRAANGERCYWECNGCFEILCTIGAEGQRRLPHRWTAYQDGSARCPGCAETHDYREAWIERRDRAFELRYGQPRAKCIPPRHRRGYR